MRYFKLFIIIHSVSSVLNLRAQERYTFQHLTGEDGLSQSQVFCIHEDSKGLLWIGTADGLNVYDGTRFTYYRHNPKNKNSLPAPTVLCIYEDNENNLWIGTDGGGLALFNKVSENFTVFSQDKRDSNSISNNKVWSICKLNRNEFAIGTFGGGINIFNRLTGKFQKLKYPANTQNKLSDLSISKMIFADNNMLWYGTRNGLKGFNIKTNAFVSYKNIPGDSTSLTNNFIEDIYSDRGNKIWIGTFNGGICMFDPKTGKFKRYNITFPGGTASLPIIHCFHDDAEGNLWVGTYGSGIINLNKSSGNYHFIANDPDNKYSLGNDIVLCFHQDKSGIIWIGTNGAGLDLFHNRFNYFNGMNELVRKNFSNKNIFSLYEDHEKILWVGSDGGGLFRVDRKNAKVINYSTTAPHPGFMGSDEIWSIIEDNEKNFWIGTVGGGLNYFDQKSNTSRIFKVDTTDINSISSNNAWMCYKDQDNGIWIGTQRGGINYLNPSVKNFEHFMKNEKDSNSLNARTVNTIAQDHDGLFYFGTQGGGLNIYDKQKKTFEHFLHNPDDPFSISSNDIYCIYAGMDDLVWIGTVGGGLNVFNKRIRKFRCYTDGNGLPNNIIYGLLPDNYGKLWLSSNSGLSEFTPPKVVSFENLDDSTENAKPFIRNFDGSDGLPSNEFNQGAYFKGLDGTMYFGCIKGIVSFHPDSIKENPLKPEVILTSFKIFEKKFPLDSNIAYKKNILLKYNQNFFSFEFALLSYLFPGKNNYAFKMEGFDTDWIYSGTRRYASYTNLDPGEYDFKVKASNNDGIWSDKIASVHIVITPPFWKTTWFKILALISLVSLAIAYFRYRVNTIRKEEQKKAVFEKELAEVEMKALRAQMNPHFIFNSLNSINKYIWANDQAAASDYLARFSRLIRLIFENSMHQSVPLSSDLEALDLYIQMERLRFENKLEYSIKVDESIDQEQVLVPPLIFQPFVENAILHGIMPKGTMGNLTLNFKATENDLIVTIEDNGIGRAAAAEKNKSRGNHKSLGMKVTKDRLDLLNQKKSIQSSVVYTDLKDEKGYSSGTLVEITLPLEYA